MFNLTMLVELLLALIVSYVAIRQILRIRLGAPFIASKLKTATSVSVTGTVQPATDSTTHTTLISHERTSGLMERWYQSQPLNAPRQFIQAYTIRSEKVAIPTVYQLRCAVSNVALKHPSLISLPNHTSDGVASQITQFYVQPNGTLIFPLEVIEPSITESTEALSVVLERLVNTPADELPTKEEYESRHVKGTTYRGLQVVLVTDEGGDDKQAKSTNQSFTLAFRLAHAIGDGMTGPVLIHHILTELLLVMNSTSPQPSEVPISALTSIAAYPCMDDLLDFRPTVSRFLEYIIGEIKGKFKSDAAKKQEAQFWCGQNLVSDPTNESLDLTPGTGVVTMPFTTTLLQRLTEQSKKNNCTIHTILTVATSLAGAVLAENKTVKIHSATPFSTRTICDIKRFKNGDENTKALQPKDLIGNFLGAYVHHFTFSSLTSESSAADFWSVCTSFQRRFLKSQTHELESVGMLGFVSIRGYISNMIQSSWRGRNKSVIVSNLGMIERNGSGLTKEFQSSTGFIIDRAYFLQPANYSAPLFLNNVVSCERGGLMNMIVYPRSIVNTKQADQYATILGSILDQVAEGATLTFKSVCEEWAQKKKE